MLFFQNTYILSDSGFDLHSTQDLEIKPFGRILVPTGIKVSFEERI
jgi:dUTPase